MSDRYFDDFHVGDRIEGRSITVTESGIIDFALQYDPQPFHLDVEAAKQTPYGGLIASGFHTLALAFRLFIGEGVFAACSLGSPGLDELRWLKPVRPGDTLRTAVEILDKRPSTSKPDRGTLRVKYFTQNQNGEPVLTFILTHLLARRPGSF